MKILAISDESSKFLWNEKIKMNLQGVDLILAAGDLSKSYLEFIATCMPVPILYVHGNHDSKLEDMQPGGCMCIDNDIYTYKGYRILGFPGCMKYNLREAYQYTEREMARNVRKLSSKIRKHKGFDILLAHAPAAGLNDGEDLAHKGYQCYIDLINKHKPKYFVHGHVHLQYNASLPRVCQYNETTVINAFERYIFEVPDLE